jgi:hypothetical protein
MQPEFSPREFLRQRQALLVHFSTIMSRHEDLFFPEDLRRALSLRQAPLAFSTIQIGDRSPWARTPGPGGEGSIGMVVDIAPHTVISSVSPCDSGSYEGGSLGLPPTEQNCAASIDQRERSNEWVVQDYEPVGIFLFHEPYVIRKPVNLDGSQTAIEVRVSAEQAKAPFPDQRIFSLSKSSFLELDRARRMWKAVSYNEIIPVHYDSR